MSFILALAETFQVTEFDVLFFMGIFLVSAIMYHYLTLHNIFEAAFGAIVGLSIYILLSVLLLGNASFGSEPGIFPPEFATIIVSIAVYLVFLLAVLFPMHGGLIISEPRHQWLYAIQFFGVAIFLFYSLFATLLYMTEQVYVFKIPTVFTWLHGWFYYIDVIQKSALYTYIIAHQNTIIPLGVLLMLYKLLLSNLVNAALLSIWFNLSNVWFYRRKDDSHYRVEFHEVGGHSSAGGEEVAGGEHSWGQGGHGGHH
jgi:hypothetical protein